LDNSSQGMLVLAKNLLAPLDRKVVFVGGATVHLHIDDPAATPVRTTKDVDVLIEAASYLEFSQLESALRDHGFEQIMTDESPICRWTKDDLLLDILPTKPEILGFAESKWFEEGFRHALQHRLPNGELIRILDVLHLLAAKIDAFHDRGNGDLFASQDFEDIATILDGSSSVWEQLIRQTEVAVFVREWLRGLDPENCEDAFAGHLGDYGRAAILLHRIDQLV